MSDYLGAAGFCLLAFICVAIQWTVRGGGRPRGVEWLVIAALAVVLALTALLFKIEVLN